MSNPGAEPRARPGRAGSRRGPGGRAPGMRGRAERAPHAGGMAAGGLPPPGRRWHPDDHGGRGHTASRAAPHRAGRPRARRRLACLPPATRWAASTPPPWGLPPARPRPPSSSTTIDIKWLTCHADLNRGARATPSAAATTKDVADVDCQGETKDGRAITVKGKVTQEVEGRCVKGDLTAKVAGRTVFRASVLGDCDAPAPTPGPATPPPGGTPPTVTVTVGTGRHGVLPRQVARIAPAGPAPRGPGRQNALSSMRLPDQRDQGEPDRDRRAAGRLPVLQDRLRRHPGDRRRARPRPPWRSATSTPRRPPTSGHPQGPPPRRRRAGRRRTGDPRGRAYARPGRSPARRGRRQRLPDRVQHRQGAGQTVFHAHAHVLGGRGLQRPARITTPHSKATHRVRT